MIQTEPKKLVSQPTQRDHWLVFSDDWGRHPSSCQYLIQHLLDRVDVTWVNTIGMRPPRLDRATLDRVVGKIHGTVSPKPRRAVGNPAPREPRVVSPWMWPWFKRAWDRSCNRWLLRKQLVDILSRGSRPSLAITTIPIVADLMDELPVDRWVYYCVDDFSLWPGLDQTAMAAMEDRVVRRADLLIAASDSLKDRLATMGRKAELCTHGVDMATWQSSSLPRFDWPAPIQGPVALFWGVVDRRLDTTFLIHLAKKMPHLAIVLIGPTQQPDPTIKKLPNVHFLAPAPTCDLSAMAQASDCLIMPYVETSLTQAMQPLKLKEYLASGRPAVVRRLPSTEPWADACDVVGTAEDFVVAVQRCLQNGVTGEQRVARRALQSESWDCKAQDFHAMVRHGE